MSSPGVIEEEARSYKIGRYEVLGPLATGGMAEILLARLVGPSGFERIVVLKRILPHFASSSSFVKMFLDEARLAAAIRHPNVVDVFELGHEEGELFLAMEYLEGESLSGLGRRLAARKEALPIALAAFVVASACAGLHAAHELVDAEGHPLDLVHRDVSPQNLFVGYDGTVKVLDFGIALARDRLTETETGALKGKVGYMSPEQIGGDVLDRRSDVFALGVVLYETSTARRLFRRESQIETMRAIADRPVPPPSTIVADYPPVLEAIVMRALERDREKRFASAAEMRTELLKAIRTLDPELVPEDALASVMRRVFPDRMSDKSAMLSRVRAGSAPTALPAAEVDVEIELPVVEPPTLAETLAEPPPRSRRVALALASTIAVALVAALALAMQTPPTHVAPVSVVPIAREVAVHLVTDPPGAHFEIDDASGTTPWDGTLPSRAGDRHLRLTLEGHAPEDETLAADHDVMLRVTMTPLPPPSVAPGEEDASVPHEHVPAAHRRTPRERSFRKFD